MKFWPAILGIALITGCARFHPEPLAPEKTAAMLETRRLDDEHLKQFMEDNVGHELKGWPLAGWDLDSLTLAAFYFHPDLAVARAQWQVSEAGIKTAGGRPNPTLSVAPTYNTTTLIPSPWSPAINFDVPLETMGKRSKRIAEAKQVSESARFNFISAAWQIRSEVRNRLLDFQMTGERAGLLQKEFAVQQQIVQRLRQQFDAGAISRTELTPAQIALNRTQMDLNDALSQQTAARSHLAEALGLDVAALDDIRFDFSFKPVPVDQLTSARARSVALRSRPDILAALADYAAAEADLRLEIAKQYPDVHLNPGYQFDQGDNKWSLGLTVELPILNQNQGAIGEAEARRKLAAAKFIQLQARVIGEIDRAVAGWHVAQSQLKMGDALLTGQQQQKESTEAQVAAGAASELDRLNAELEFDNAALVQLDNQSKWRQALGQLEDALQSPLTLPDSVFQQIQKDPNETKPASRHEP